MISLTGCAEISRQEPGQTAFGSQPVSFPKQIQDLSGNWEYQDQAGEGDITLNADGVGKYDWKDGRFVTESFEEGVWKGKWIQKENDREGGFELRFSTDPHLATGKWWYTRIGEDQDPLEPGGEFSMKRISTNPLGTQNPQGGKLLP